MSNCFRSTGRMPDGIAHPTAHMAAAILLFLTAVAPCRSAPDSFVTQSPSPLTLAKEDDDGVAHFTGTVELSGQFLVKWDLRNKRPYYLRAIFFPAESSTAILPRPVGEGPVKELLFPNSDKAAALLLDAETAQRILTKELLSAKGEATVTIGDYRAVVDCDHRWYLAELISVSSNLKIAGGAYDNRHFGC